MFLKSGRIHSYYRACIAATLFAVMHAAHAQSSVTLYGRVVAGIDYSSNVSQDGITSGSRLSAASNQWGTSLLGLKGSEDLGKELKAIFNLESGFSTPAGMTNSAALFDRYAYVGLSSATIGTIKFGNFLSISNDTGQLDPMSRQWLSTSTLVRGRSSHGAKNAIQYELPSWSGFGATLQYSLGEQPGDNTANSKTGISLAYTGENYALRLIYDTARDHAGQYSSVFLHSRELTLGGYLETGAAKWYAAMQWLDAPDAPISQASRIRHSWFGVKYQLTPACLVRLAGFHVKPDRAASSANLLAVGTDYSLSTRTLLYATIGRINNGSLASYSERHWEPHVAGQNQTSIYFGVSHTF